MKQCTFLAAILFCITSSFSQIPQTISWQGILQDADSKNLSGTFSLTVKLYDVASGGTAIWNETHSSVVIADGLVNIMLGSVTPFSVNFEDEYWLEITVGSGTPLPRIKLSSVPYAMRSKTAEAFNETDPTWSGNANTTGTISRSGKVGIGTGNPLYQLHVNSPGIFTGILMTTDAAGTTMSDGFIIGMQYQSDEPVNRYATVLNKENSPLHLGTNNNYHGDITILPGGNIGIGVNPPTARLDVNGQVRIRGGSPSAGKVLTSDANGVATWQPSSIHLPYSGSMSYPSQSVFTVTNSATNGYSAIQGYAMGNTSGVAGLADQGTGVLGYSYAGKGVHGYVTTGDSPIAIFGQNESILGNPIAVKGQVAVSNGYSGHFNGGRFYISGNTGIGTTSPTALLHLHETGFSGGNVVFVGEYLDHDIHQPPVSGSGTRMMWYPNKAAFRAGRVISTQWNKDNIGYNSVAFGYNTKASGNSSTAMGVSTTASDYASTAIGNATTASGNSSTAFGNNTIASGENSTAMGASSTASNYGSTAMGLFATASGYCSAALGEQTTASGENSIAMGYKSKASGYASTALGESTTASGILSYAMGFNSIASANFSTAIGYSTTASGAYSTAMGFSTIAKSGYETAIGRYNLDYTPASTTGWNVNDRLFVIGNGSSSASRSNALTVLKNGRIGIGTEWPSELLHLNNSTGTAKLRVSSASTALSELTFYSGNSYVGAIGSDNANNYFYIYQGGNIIFKNGRIGIQSETNPTFAVHLPNSTSDGVGKGRANAWTTYSDKRIKTATEKIQYGLSEIMQLQPVKYFQHNSKFEDVKLVISDIGANDIGFIAQDIFKIIPEIVSVPDNENTELWGLNYEKLTPILVKAIQEQQAIIDEQNKRIEELEKKLEQLLHKFSENK